MASLVNFDFDDILKEIAKAIYKNVHINDLGKALEFEPADIGRAIEENTKQGGNYMGTLDLLRTWRHRHTPSTEKAGLRSALLKARFDNLADQHLSIPVTERTVRPKENRSQHRDGKQVSWEILTGGLREMSLQNDEVIMLSGIRFSTSGSMLNEPLKVSLNHNAHFSHLKRAEIFSYIRDKVSTTLKIGPAFTDAYQPSHIRAKDLDCYVNPFSDWWIVAVIIKYFVGKRVTCTPYIRPPVTRGFTHLVILLLNDDRSDVIQKINEEMKEYRKLYPPQQMFVRWGCGDINIKLFGRPEGKEEQIAEKILGQKDIMRNDRKRFSFEVKPPESGESQTFLEFALDQKESTSCPTLIHFNLPYDGMISTTTLATPTTTTTVEAMAVTGAASLSMHARSQAAWVSTQSGTDLEMDRTFDRLSKHMPAEKYTSLCTHLGIGYYDANNILYRVTNDYQRATRSCFAQWKTGTGGNMTRLKTILREIEVGDLVKYIE